MSNKRYLFILSSYQCGKCSPNQHIASIVYFECLCGVLQVISETVTESVASSSTSTTESTTVQASGDGVSVHEHTETTVTTTTTTVVSSTKVTEVSAQDSKAEKNLADKPACESGDGSKPSIMNIQSVIPGTKPEMKVNQGEITIGDKKYFVVNKEGNKVTLSMTPMQSTNQGETSESTSMSGMHICIIVEVKENILLYWTSY